MLVFFTFATIACGWAFQLDPGIENCIHVFYLMTPNGTSQSSVRNEVVAKAQLRASEGRTQPRDSLPCPVNVEKEIEPPSKVDADEMRRLRGSSKNVAKPRNERLAPLKSTSVSSSRVFRGQSVRKIGVFKALLWTDWTAVRQLYMALRLPTAHMKEVKGTRNKRGKYARWASLVLSAAYAVQFQLPYLVLLEDDSVWPPLRQLQLGVAQALRHIPGNGNSTRVIKLSKWGEGYVFPLQAAELFLTRIYNLGIHKHSDNWIREYMDVFKWSKIPMELRIRPNEGNIYKSAFVENSQDFNYQPADPITGSRLLFRLLGCPGCATVSRWENRVSAFVFKNSASDRQQVNGQFNGQVNGQVSGAEPPFSTAPEGSFESTAGRLLFDSIEDTDLSLVARRLALRMRVKLPPIPPKSKQVKSLAQNQKGLGPSNNPNHNPIQARYRSIIESENDHARARRGSQQQGHREEEQQKEELPMAFGASTSRGRSRSRSTESQRRLVRGDSRQGGGGDRVGGRGGSRGGGRRAGHRRWTGSERNLPGTFQRSASGNQGGTTAVNMVEYPRYSGGGSDSMVFTKIESAKHKPILLDG